MRASIWNPEPTFSKSGGQVYHNVLVALMLGWGQIPGAFWPASLPLGSVRNPVHWADIPKSTSGLLKHVYQ